MGRPRKGWSLRKPRHPGDNYSVRFTDKAGRPRELTTGTDDPGQAAVEAALIYARDLTSEALVRPRVSPHIALDETFALWLADLEKTHDRETCATYTGYAKRYVEFFGTLANITKARMGDYQRGRLLAVTAKSVRKERSALNTFFAWCVEQGVLTEESVPIWPKLSKKSLGTRSGKQRSAPVDITPEQANAFLAALPAWSRPFKGISFAIRAYFVVAYETSLRPATLDALSVPQHWRPGQIFLRITEDIDKARFGRSVPITERARLALEETWAMSRKDAGVVFGVHDRRDAVEKARIVSGLPEEFAPYDLRHGRIGHLLDATGDMRGVGLLAGHILMTTTNNYVRAQEKNARAVIAAAGFGDKPGNKGLPMLSAKEGTRTLTGVTPLEPESGVGHSGSSSYEDVDVQARAQSGSREQGFGDIPETLNRAATYLAVLRGEWDAFDAIALQDDTLER